MAKRKYNRILWCDKTVNGYWSIGMESPGGAILRRTYIGYSKRDALYKARREPDGVLVNVPLAHIR